MSKTILCDMDDVMEDLVKVWVDVLNKDYDKDIKPEDITEWDLEKFYPDLTHEQIFQPFLRESFWEATKPVKDSVKYLKKLWDEGYKIYVVTSTHYKNIDLKIKYVLKRYFPFIPVENMVISHHKQMILGDFLIDDNPKNLPGGKYTPILFDTPHNRVYNDEGLNRMYNWKEVYNFIKSNS